MATPIDFLNAPDFADDKLTEAINVPDFKTGRPAQLGIFTDTPIRTTYVRLGVEEQELFVIPARERGGEPNFNTRGKVGAVDFHIPHFPLDDAIRPADIQNVVSWDADMLLKSTSDVYTTKLEDLQAKHDVTHSHLDWGALNGKVFDITGKLVVDVYEEFDLDQTILEFDTAAAFDVSAFNRLAKGRVRTELRGAQATGMRCLAGKTFFEKYVSHGYVNEQLKQYAGQAANPSRDEVEDVFTFSGLTIELIDEMYRYKQADGTFTTQKAIADDEAILVPLGTPYFKRYIAPPDTLSGANVAPDVDTKIFVSTHDLPHDKGREIHTESNVLPICIRPQLITKMKLKAA